MDIISRNDFLNELIGTLGFTELYIKEFGLTEIEYLNLSDEEFEEKFIRTFNDMGINDLNNLSEKYNFGYKITI